MNPSYSKVTLIDLLERAATGPRGVSFIESDGEQHDVSYAALVGRALGLLHVLQQRGVQRGDHIILFVRQNDAFLDAFWACQFGGFVPVPVGVGISDEHRFKLLRIAALLGQPWIFSDRKSLGRIEDFAGAVEHGDAALELRKRSILLEEISDLGNPGKPQAVVPSDTAFIQFSSGSTSAPKGVVLTHANLVANWHGISTATRFCETDSALSWMPLTHDMGLIAMHLFMVGSGLQCAIMPTELFIRRPLLWLETASRRRATILASPNFGYRYYLKLLGDRPVSGLDLSCVRVIYNGAEPISAALCREFQRRMASAGLPANAVFPVYGLAEASVGVSTPVPGMPMHTQIVDRHSLQVGSLARRLESADERDALELVAVGRAAEPCELRIAGETDEALPAAHVGHIQIRGANVTMGYFRNPDATALLHTADGWVRTGDIGMIDGGHLFITGRAKEVILVNGQNYYPHDIEGVALQTDGAGLELGKVVAAGVQRPGAATDELVLFLLHRTDLESFLPIAIAVARRVNEQTGLEVAAVVPVKRIPKTTSGKIQRHLLEEELLSGAYDDALQQLQAMREQRRDSGCSAGGGSPAASAIEAELLKLCRPLLPAYQLTARDNLFEIGASSLKLIEIHERIDAMFPRTVDLPELADHPTLAQLAQHIERRLQSRQA